MADPTCPVAPVMRTKCLLAIIGGSVYSFGTLLIFAKTNGFECQLTDLGPVQDPDARDEIFKQGEPECVGREKLPYPTPEPDCWVCLA